MLRLVPMFCKELADIRKRDEVEADVREFDLRQTVRKANL